MQHIKQHLRNMGKGHFSLLIVDIRLATYLTSLFDSELIAQKRTCIYTRSFKIIKTLFIFPTTPFDEIYYTIYYTIFIIKYVKL